MDEEPTHQVRDALLKGLAAVVVIGLVIALGTVIAVRALGLDDDSSRTAAGSSGAGSDAPDPLPTTALPVPGDESSGATDEESPSEDPTPAKARVIRLDASPLRAGGMERVNLTGTYRKGDNVTLQVQRFENGTWADFGVQATVRVGTFETYVMTGRTGENRFRVFDPTSRRASNPVRVTIG